MTITAYVVAHYLTPESQRITPIKPDHADLEAGFFELAQVEIEPVTGVGLEAAIKRGHAQRQALAKMNNNAPLFMRDKEKAA